MSAPGKKSGFNVGTDEISGQFALFVSVFAAAAIILTSLRSPAYIGFIYPAAVCVILTSHIFCGPAASSAFLAFFSIVSLLGVLVAAAPNKIIFAGAAAVSAAVFAALLKYDAALSSRRAQCAHDREELELALNESANKLAGAKTLASNLAARVENYSRLAGFLRSICKIININELTAELRKSAGACFGGNIVLSFLSDSAPGAKMPGDENDVVLSRDGLSASARFAGRGEFAWISARSSSGKLTDDDLRLLSPAFGFAAAAASNVILYEKTKVLSIRDSLTGLYLRDYFFERLDEEFELARGHGEPLSVIMFDIDHFKKINDALGHSAGDETLKAVAGTMCHRLRETDMLARYGGEEFVAMLPHTGVAEAARVASEIRKTLEHEKIRPCPSDGRVIGVTVSAGVAAMEPDRVPSSAGELIKNADENLYKAKNSGRNKVFPEVV